MTPFLLKEAAPLVELTKKWQTNRDIGFHWTEAQILAEVEQDHVIALNSEEGGVVAALVFLPTPSWWEVLWLVVEPVFIRQGLAVKLLQDLELRAKAAGSQKLCLEVSALNTGAIKFYEKNGFVEDGLRPKYYGGQIDAVLMSKCLE